MDSKSLDKALEITAKLIQGEEVGKNRNVALYEEYGSNMEVYEIVESILKKWNLSLYEYQNTLYVSPGMNNRVFGFRNEEIKKELGVRLNRELYLCYFIMYQVVQRFYHDSGSYNYMEYCKVTDVVSAVDSSLSNLMHSLNMFVRDEVEESSFKAIAMVWADLPLNGKDELTVRAVKTTRMGYVKLVLHFMVEQNLLLEVQEKYYPKNRFKALAEQYFEEYKGRLYELFATKEEA